MAGSCSLKSLRPLARQRHLFCKALLAFAVCAAAAEPALAQAAGGSPWTQAVQAFKPPLPARSLPVLALVAIVVGGLMFAFGEGAAKRTLSGVIFGVGMAVGAVNFMSWLFP